MHVVPITIIVLISINVHWWWEQCTNSPCIHLWHCIIETYCMMMPHWRITSFIILLHRRDNSRVTCTNNIVFKNITVGIHNKTQLFWLTRPPWIHPGLLEGKGCFYHTTVTYGRTSKPDYYTADLTTTSSVNYLQWSSPLWDPSLRAFIAGTAGTSSFYLLPEKEQ